MDKEHLDQLIASINGCTFASLDTWTEPAIRGGRDNPFVGHILKHTIGRSVMLFTGSLGYENMVRRRLEREGLDPDGFILSNRPWGERLPGTPYVNHKGRLYLECILRGFGQEEYRWNGARNEAVEAISGVSSIHDPIPREVIIGLKDRSEAEQGGLANKVELRVYDLDHIEAIRLMKEEVR